MEWPGDAGVEFHLPHGEWIRLLRRNGFEVEDPTLFTQVWRGEEVFRPAEGAMYEYACHEGNYAMTGILAGARQAEKDGKPVDGSRGQIKEEGGN